MAESDVNMAGWACRSLTGCAGIIASFFVLREGVLMGSSLLDVSAALGPLRMSPDIGNRKRLLTKQCSCPGFGAHVLVQTCLWFSGSGALHNGEQESEEAVDSEDIEKEVSVVVGVVCIDSNLIKRSYPLSGEPVHPGFSPNRKDLVARSAGLHWDHSRLGG